MLVASVHKKNPYLKDNIPNTELWCDEAFLIKNQIWRSECLLHGLFEQNKCLQSAVTYLFMKIVTEFETTRSLLSKTLLIKPKGNLT